MRKTGCWTERHRVPKKVRGQRLDVWLSGLDQAGTRSQIRAAILAGDITIDGVVVEKVARRLQGGEAVSRCRRRPQQSQVVLPQALPIDVLFADESFLAINKPAGMVVHPAAGHRSGTLVNAILHYFPCPGWPGGAERAGIVHRLDRDTSGVILVARTPETHENLSRQFRERSVEKLYLALVDGVVGKAGEINEPIGRHPRDRKRMSTAARRARQAVTGYEPLEAFPSSTLLLVRPKTGRTHQIRVHLASRGWPVVGDRVYGGRKRPRRQAGEHGQGAGEQLLLSMPRQALHAWRIRFLHPRTGHPLDIEAPVPLDFERLLSLLRAGPAPGS